MYATYKPKAIGCILAIPESEITYEFYTFLKKHKEIYRKADFNNTFTQPTPRLKSVVFTKKYAKNLLPKGIIAIPVPTDSAKMTFAF